MDIKGKGKAGPSSNVLDKSTQTSKTESFREVDTPSETVTTNPQVRNIDASSSEENGFRQANLPETDPDLPLQEQTPLNPRPTNAVNSNIPEARFINGE